MNIPENIKYTKDHEWLKVKGKNATIGVTDFAQRELGDIVFVEVETEGEDLAKEEVFGTIEAVKTVSDLFIPISAEVIEFNQKLDDNPELINNDPYEGGWIVKVSISDDSELEDLLSSEEYKNLIS